MNLKAATNSSQLRGTAISLTIGFIGTFKSEK
jgi:hypothetical protein